MEPYLCFRRSPVCEYSGVAYRDYFRCLPDVLNKLAARAYRERNGQMAALTTPEAVRKR